MTAGVLFPCTIEEQVAEVERELQLRREVYPRQVAAHKMSQPRADLQERRMYAVLGTLRKVQAEERAKVAVPTCARK